MRAIGPDIYFEASKDGTDDDDDKDIIVDDTAFSRDVLRLELADETVFEKAKAASFPLKPKT